MQRPTFSFGHFAATLAVGLTAGLIALTTYAGDSASPVGLWKAFDEQGKPTGFILITEQDGVLGGIVERGLPTDIGDKYCTACRDYRKDQRLLGMEILSGLHRDGEGYEGDEILEPFSGNVYRAKLTLLENGAKLKVRGYVGFSLFGTTQIWQREE